MGFVSECPKSQTEVGLASKRLGCDSDKYGNNQYICAPNDSKTSLVEICIDGIMGIQNKGNCLAVTGRNITTHSCLSFSSGCPANHFWSSDFFQYPACQRINTQYRCYEMDPSCTSETKRDETGNTHLIGYICGGIGGLLVLISLVIVLVILWKKGKDVVNKDVEAPEQEQLNPSSSSNTKLSGKKSRNSDTKLSGKNSPNSVLMDSMEPPKKLTPKSASSSDSFETNTIINFRVMQQSENQSKKE